jgi:CRISPR-associated endonuclease/helicase Cas3
LHLHGVANLAEQFAAVFGSAAWGRLAGLWHDLGKYQVEFQAKLRGERMQVEHAGIGAALAAAAGGPSHPLAFVIAGHHAGLANREAQLESGLTPLKERLLRNQELLRRCRAAIPSDLCRHAIPAAPPFFAERGRGNRRAELWTRFLFSALVDADRLATEAFCNPVQSRQRTPFASIAELRSRVDKALDRLAVRSDLDRIRADILADCRAAAARQRGIFSLTVPTGGGKTLSSLAFALRHAERHGLRRVIVAIPYTSIIEQNAAVYRRVLSDENVIEHHASIDELGRAETNPERELRRQLACENWDAPVVVTTNVQLFESLFSNHPSRCRKLHNVAGSVIVLDEAQALPAGYLLPVLDVLAELTAVYGCSVVLCTATQPALGQRPALPKGLKGVTEIATAPDSLARQLKRVRIRWLAPGQVTPYRELADELVGLPRVLAIVHLRRDARFLASLLPAEGLFHLSTLMCAAHRQAVLARIRTALADGLRCRVVATQLIEAGVDVDFPVVYRALAGLDSLAQAAGRCNREGKLPAGEFHVFRAETLPPPGTLRIGLETTESLLKQHGQALGFDEPRLFEEYFRMLYAKLALDGAGIQHDREQFNFAEVDRKFRLIDSAGRTSLVVPYTDEARERLARYLIDPSRTTVRALQPFIVQLLPYERRALIFAGALDPVNESLDALNGAFDHLYDGQLGLLIDDSALPDPSALML